MSKQPPPKPRLLSEGLTTKHFSQALGTCPGTVEGQKSMTTAHMPQALGTATPSSGSAPAPASGAESTASKAKT